MTHRDNASFELILFDLGGVIIELGGMAQMLTWSQQLGRESVLWQQWLSSQTVRDFESGRSTPNQFAQSMITEFNLPVSAERFLAEFSHWAKDTYTGAEELLAHLSGRFGLGILSNTNEIHWQRFIQEMDFLRFFDWLFPSHLTGRLKPDEHTFVRAAEATGCSPERILFFDDNQINVDSAKAVGMAGYTATGVSGVIQRLIKLGIFDSTSQLTSAPEK